MPTQALPARAAGAALRDTAAHARPPEQQTEAGASHGPAPPASLQETEAVIAGIVGELVGAGVAPDAPLAAQGLDSLAALELRRQLEARATAPDASQLLMNHTAPSCA